MKLLAPISSQDTSSNKAKIIQVSAALILMFITGSTFALGVFTVPVEMSIGQQGSQDAAWPLGMGLMHLLSAPTLIIAGLIIDSAQRKGQNTPIRALSAVSATCFAMLSVSASGLSTKVRWVVIAGVGAQSVPLGVLYPLVIELLFSWMPDAPGTAVGLGQLSFGFGSIFSAWVYHMLISIYGVGQALCVSAIVSGIVSFVASMFISWNPNSNKKTFEGVDETRERTALLQNPEIRIPWSKLIISYQFWLYIVVVLTAGASYAFIPYYFKLGRLFGATPSELIWYFQLTSLAATVFGMVSSMWTEKLSVGTNGPFSSGARNLMGLFLIFQTIFMGSLIWISQKQQFGLFVIAIAILKMIMASHAGCAVLVARDVFGEVNSCIVFGIGGGLALGGGEGLSAATMTLVESWIAGTDGRPIPGDYNAFYIIATVWSVIGTLCLVLLRRQTSHDFTEHEQALICP